MGVLLAEAAARAFPAFACTMHNDSRTAFRRTNDAGLDVTWLKAACL